MTLSPRERLKYEARLELAKFAACVYPSYQRPVPAHLTLINSALEQVAEYIRTDGERGIGKLRIEVHPRSGKSQTVARIFPAWILGKFPDTRVIIASYGETLSVDHARAVRNILRGGNFASVFPKVKLAPDSQAKNAWDLSEPLQGGLISAGLNGAVTGKGAGLLICDDLVKGRAEAESATMREQTWSWYTNDLITRLNSPYSPVVHIGTRWRQDDLLGTLAINEPDAWHVIRLPAFAEENDPLGREVGEALWPVTFVKKRRDSDGRIVWVKRRKFDREFLLEQQQTLGDYAFSALYQCDPITASGGIFTRDKFRLIDEPPAGIVQRVRFWDLAISEKKNADYTVGSLLGLSADKRIVVLDVQRVRRGWQSVMDRISEIALADGPDVRIGIESVAFSAAAVSDLLVRPELHDYSIRGYEVHKDKTTRALPFAARVDSQMVDVLRRSWTGDFLDELCAFPNGKHDDQVDSAASAFGMLPVTLPRDAAFPNFVEKHISATAEFNAEAMVYASMVDGFEADTPRVALVGQLHEATGALCLIGEHYAVHESDYSLTLSAVNALCSKAPGLVYIPKEADVLSQALYKVSMFHSRVEHDLTESIKQVRLMLETGRLLIHPRCQRLIADMKLASFAEGSKTVLAPNSVIALAQLAWRQRFSTATFGMVVWDHDTFGSDSIFPK